MKILKVYPSSINRRFIEEGVSVMQSGGIILYPTDSYYALGCDALNNKAVETICRLKGINAQKETLSIVCDNLSQASEYARIDNRAFSALKHNLPGPITFLLPASTTLPKIFKGRKIVGVRVPDNAIARALAEELGHPLLSTTATTEMIEPEEIAMEWDGRGVTLMIDGGSTPQSPSTVVDMTDSTEPVVVREGLKEFEA